MMDTRESTILAIFYLARVETLANFIYQARRSDRLESIHTHTALPSGTIQTQNHNSPMRRHQTKPNQKMKLKHKTRLRKGFSLVELLVVIAIIAGLAAMSYGPIMKQVKAASLTNALNNGKQIYTALFSYAKDNDGLYPNEGTAGDGETGDSAEACFTQLLNAGVIDDEEAFWSKENIALGTVNAETPDNDGELTPGENAWGYVRGLSTSSRTNLPIIFDSSDTAGQFDTVVWEGKAIVAKLNGSVEAMKINYGGGRATEDDGSSKTGSIEEKRGATDLDIFSSTALPNGADVLVPGS